MLSVTHIGGPSTAWLFDSAPSVGQPVPTQCQIAGHLPSFVGFPGGNVLNLVYGAFTIVAGYTWNTDQGGSVVLFPDGNTIIPGTGTVL